MSSNNRILIASAGSGKTTTLVKHALAHPEERILFLTYTLNNYNEIIDKFIEENGHVPANVKIKTWYRFLLQEMVRPYQRNLDIDFRVSGVNFSIPSKYRSKRNNVEKWYFTSDQRIYSEVASDFAYELEVATHGKPISRLSMLYDHIFIDEFQDLSGYDLDLLDRLFDSSIKVTCVGDPRQAIYNTTLSQRNKQFRKTKIVDWVLLREKENIVTCKYMNASRRCNQVICDFGNELFPEFEPSTSLNGFWDDSCGVFTMSTVEIHEYIIKYQPAVLRWDKDTDTLGYAAINFGKSKGMTFDRVVIFPTIKFKKYLRTKKLSDAGDRSKAYVAITRARHSVVFVI